METTTSTDYDRALALLNGRPTKKLANNTYARREEDGSVVIRLHATDILTYRPSGEVVYNSGGWLTVTTKRRMNDYGAHGVWIVQSKGLWYVQPAGTWASGAYNRAEPLTDYYDGVTIRDGELVTREVHQS